MTGSSRIPAYGTRYGAFGTVGPNSVASRTPSQGSGGTGACSRCSPNGGAAYGIPLKEAMPCSARPRTRPCTVVTTGPDTQPVAGGLGLGGVRFDFGFAF